LIRLPNAVVVVGVALVALLGGSAASQAKQGSEVTAIHAADAAWEKAYNAGQVEGVVALYDENAVVYPPGVAALQGHAAIQEYFAKDMPEFGKSGLSIVLDPNPSGGTSGDTGWSSGTWTVKDKAGNVVDSGWYFSVSRKVKGKWLYVRDAWNSNKPVAPAAAMEK
jgi:ketosteroid isomerase-like protein